MQHPQSAGKSLGLAPFLHPTAQVRDCTFGVSTEVGERTIIAETSMADYSYVVNDSDIMGATIGKFRSIASAVRINPGNHPLDRVALSHFTYRASAYGLGEDDPAVFAWRRAAAVSLGHDVWVGHGAIILPGRHIDTGAAIGAGAVVTRDVPDFAVVAGNPARILRCRFPPAIQAALHRIAWWDWPHERLRDRMVDFRTLGAEAFCARHDVG